MLDGAFGDGGQIIPQKMIWCKTGRQQYPLSHKKIQRKLYINKEGFDSAPELAVLTSTDNWSVSVIIRASGTMQCLKLRFK